MKQFKAVHGMCFGLTKVERCSKKQHELKLKFLRDVTCEEQL